MPQVIEQFDMTQILMPAKFPERALFDSYGMAPNLTITKGTFMGLLTATQRLSPYVHGNADGSQTPVAITMYSFVTDANGLVYYGPTASPSYRESFYSTTPCFIAGIFDPTQLITGTLAGEVYTYTIGGTLAANDTMTITLTKTDLTTEAITYTMVGTTLAEMTAGLAALWNADPVLTFYAAATSTGTTVVLTSANTGQGFTVASTKASASGTITGTVTTAAAGRSLTNILGGDWPGSRLLGDGNLYVC